MVKDKGDTPFYEGQLRVHFWESGHAQYSGKDNIITLPEPKWTAYVSGPYYDWTKYWQTVAHEVAHKIIWDWFGGINHRETFYAALIALCSWWDLPPRVMDSEIGYHTTGYRKGKKQLALLAMDRINGIAKGVDCDERPLFDLEVCRGTPCTVHKPKPDSIPPDTERPEPTPQTAEEPVR